MERELLNQALLIFNDEKSWNAFIDLTNYKSAIERTWTEKAKLKIKEKFRSDDKYIIEYGDFWDIRWHLISNNNIKLNFWFSIDGNLHFIINSNPGERAEKIKEIFIKPAYDQLRYLWGTDIQFNINHEIKLRQEVKWQFGSPYDGNMKFNRLVWFAGNKTDEFISQLEIKVNQFKKAEIIELLMALINEIEQALYKQQLIIE